MPAATTSEMMEPCHEHNLNSAEDPDTFRFGIRVSLKPGDPFNLLVDRDWETHHWFATAAERDTRLADMAGEHLYSRKGDEPSLIFEPVER